MFLMKNEAIKTLFQTRHKPPLFDSFIFAHYAAGCSIASLPVAAPGKAARWPVLVRGSLLMVRWEAVLTGRSAS